MHKCCCCSVKTGSILIGSMNFISSILVLIPLAGYLADTDTDGLNVIQKHDKYLENVLEDILKEHNWTMHSYLDIMDNVRTHWPTAALVFTILAGVSAMASLMLILGVKFSFRYLLVPHLVLTMLDIIVAGAFGIVVVVALFWSNIVPGLVALFVYLVVAVFSLYSWTVVLVTYKQLAQDFLHDGYVYSPAPMKNGMNGYSTDYYPSAPQHFVMEDFRDRKA